MARKIDHVVLVQLVLQESSLGETTLGTLKTIKAWLFPYFTQKLGGWSIFQGEIWKEPCLNCLERG